MRKAKGGEGKRDQTRRGAREVDGGTGGVETFFTGSGTGGSARKARKSECDSI